MTCRMSCFVERVRCKRRIFLQLLVPQVSLPSLLMVDLCISFPLYYSQLYPPITHIFPITCCNPSLRHATSLVQLDPRHRILDPKEGGWVATRRGCSLQQSRCCGRGQRIAWRRFSMGFLWAESHSGWTNTSWFRRCAPLCPRFGVQEKLVGEKLTLLSPQDLCRSRLQSWSRGLCQVKDCVAWRSRLPSRIHVFRGVLWLDAQRALEHSAAWPPFGAGVAALHQASWEESVDVYCCCM